MSRRRVAPPWAPSFKFSSCKLSPSAARAAVEGTKNCAGKGARATAGYTS